MPTRRRGVFGRHWKGVAAIFCAVLLLFVFHAAILALIGAALVISDPLRPADVLAMTSASREAGLIEIADLYREGWAHTVVLLRPSATEVEQELLRRGVTLPDRDLDTLQQLGVPRASVVTLSNGDGGTTASTQALTDWLRQGPARWVIVVVSQSHARRYGRALRRGWPPKWPLPIIRTSRFGLFRWDQWWTTRTQLRDGLTELEKLALDYLTHPF